MKQLTQEFAVELNKAGLIRRGDFTLKSGQKSDIYCNIRELIQHPNLFRLAGRLLCSLTKSLEFDMICGVPNGAVPLATYLMMEWDVPMIMHPKQAKGYGVDHQIEPHSAGQLCLVVEDVLTTGGSTLETVRWLESQGMTVNDIISVIDREQGSAEKLMLYNLDSILTLDSIREAVA